MNLRALNLTPEAEAALLAEQTKHRRRILQAALATAKGWLSPGSRDHVSQQTAKRTIARISAEISTLERT